MFGAKSPAARVTLRPRPAKLRGHAGGMATRLKKKEEGVESAPVRARRIRPLGDDDGGEPAETPGALVSEELEQPASEHELEGDLPTTVAFAQFPLVRLEGAESEGTGDEAPAGDEGDGTEQGTLGPQPSPGEGGAASAALSTVATSAPKRRRKVRTEQDRAQQRRVATVQRQRHEELLREWMPSQRGANMALATRIGSQTVEGWFKRTFVRLSRMLYRIHTFPMQQLPPEAIATIEREVLAAIGKAETALSGQLGRCEETLERVGGRRAFYAKHFELEIIVSTKTAMALHAVYHRADELMLLIESLDFAGLLTDAQRRKQIGAMHAAIFGLAQSIERLHRGLYVRVAKAVAEVAEIDAVDAVAAGGPVDLDLDAAPASANEPGHHG